VDNNVHLDPKYLSSVAKELSRSPKSVKKLAKQLAPKILEHHLNWEWSGAGPWTPEEVSF
jgi:hypothetical protein